MKIIQGYVPKLTRQLKVFTKISRRIQQDQQKYKASLVILMPNYTMKLMIAKFIGVMETIIIIIINQLLVSTAGHKPPPYASSYFCVVQIVFYQPYIARSTHNCSVMASLVFTGYPQRFCPPILLEYCQMGRKFFFLLCHFSLSQFFFVSREYGCLW